MTQRSKPKTRGPDGVSLKGCDFIYSPGGQANEYSPLAANPYDGCGHRCLYCYVPLFRHITRAQFDAGAKERENYIEKLTKDARHYRQAGITEQVLVSFTSDP
jgi:DNA repair photolyase